LNKTGKFKQKETLKKQQLENNEQGTSIFEDKMKFALGLLNIQKLTNIKHERDN